MFSDLKKEKRFSRLGKAFKTETNNYFYDTGTGKVFQISDNLFEIISCLSKTDDFNKLYDLKIPPNKLLESLKELEAVISTEHILSAYPVETMEYPSLQESLKALKQVELEVTEKCNLRCKYCVYHDGQSAFRTFGQDDMSISTAQKAIDILASSSSDEVNLSFYGGEPLIKFDLIKECIKYCKKKLNNKIVHYNMATNCTLVTPAVAEYLSTIDNFYITVSIDGPIHIHNKNRVFTNGAGSFEKTLLGFKNLVTAYGNKAKTHLNINSVIADPRHEVFDEMQNFFDNLEWLPKGIVFTNSYISTGDIDEEYLGVDTPQERNELQKFEQLHGDMDPLTNWSMNLLESNQYDIGDNPLISRDSMDKELACIHKRLLVDKPIKSYSMNGCCVPGARRLYVTVNGDFKICEKMGPSPSIGNVNEGININNITKHYIKDFTNEAIKYCNECWAVNLCSLCYMKCFDENGIHISYRHSTCMSNRWILERYLVKYHELLENNPTSLEYLNDYVLY